MAVKRVTFKPIQIINSDENKKKFWEANRNSSKSLRLAKATAMKISMQSWIPEKGSRWCTSLPKPEIEDQNISQICLSSIPDVPRRLAFSNFEHLVSLSSEHRNTQTDR